MIITCQKEPACHRYPRHNGVCRDRKGTPIPPNKPVEVIKVMNRDSNGKPDAFESYHV